MRRPGQHEGSDLCQPVKITLHSIAQLSYSMTGGWVEGRDLNFSLMRVPQCRKQMPTISDLRC